MPVDHAVKQLKAKAASMAAVERGGHKPVAAKVAPRRALKVANGNGSGGFAFAMDDAGDERDADFQR
jgi:methyl-accepting chemotaxis protein